MILSSKPPLLLLFFALFSFILPSTATCPDPTVTATVTVTPVTVSSCPTPTPTTTTEPTLPQGFNCVIDTVLEIVMTGTNTSNATFSVSLGTQPPSDVTLTLSASCVTLSTSVLVFTNLTWNIPQDVTVFNNILSQLENNCTIEIAASGPMECLGVGDSIPVYKTKPPGGGGGSWGDPHYITFDGTRYETLSKGDYYFVREDTTELVVQLRQDQCGRATCNYAVAVRYRTCVFYVYFTEIEGMHVPVASLVGDAHANGVVIGSFNDKYSLYTLDDPILVEVIPGVATNDRWYFLSINVFLGNGYQRRFGGLAGYFDGNPANDFLMLSGSLTDNAETFANSWRVLEYENLFRNPNALISTLFGAPRYSGPLRVDVASSTFSPPGDITAQLQAQAGTESPLKDQPIPYSGPIASCKFNLTDPEYVQALAICQPYFETPAAVCCDALGVTAAMFLSSCICDYILSDHSLEFAYDSVETYLQRCETKAADQDAASCLSCPRGCSGQGTCTLGTCECNSGFHGADCSEDWNASPRLYALTPSSVSLGCDMHITLSGRELYGSDLVCDFGSDLRVPAVAISSFQLSCLVPSAGFPSGATSAPVRVIRSDGKFSSSLALALNPSPCVRGICSSPLGIPTCDCTGTGYTGPRCDNLVNCEAVLNDDHADFPAVRYPGISWGTCHTGYFGKPNRVCQTDGTFGPISNPCTIPTGQCPEDTYSNAIWPDTPANSRANGTCLAGFTGSPTRKCRIDAIWETSVLNLCTRILCPQEPLDGVLWPATKSLELRYVPCPVGKGNLNRFCSASGQWDPVVNGVCRL